MEVVRKGRRKSRLNSLVELFEKGAKSDSVKDTSSNVSLNTPGKLCNSKLQPLTKRKTEEDCAQNSKDPSTTSSSAVRGLITTFESRKTPPDSEALLSRRLNGNLSFSVRTYPVQNYPEVTRLVQEVFTRILERFQEKRPISSSFSEPDLTLCPSLAMTESSEGGSPPCVESYTWSETSPGKIGALWTHEALDSTDLSPFRRTFNISSTISEICSKFPSHIKKTQHIRSDSAGSCSIKKTVELILANFQQEEDVSSGSVENSVKTYKALIEMTVLKEEVFHPTVNPVNRVPFIPLMEDQEVTILKPRLQTVQE